MTIVDLIRLKITNLDLWFQVALLQNHGILSTGKTIEAAVFWFLSMEKCCHSQLLADAACGGRGGRPVQIDDLDAAKTYVSCPPPQPCGIADFYRSYKSIGSDVAGWFSGIPLFDMIDKETGGDYKN